MKVTRTQIQELETENFEIGDKISIDLEGFGRFTATAQKVTEDGTWFLFDSIVCTRCMNERWSNEGGYDASDLKKWIETELLESFPKDIQSRIKKISIPSYGQIFGHDAFYERFEPDNDEQFQLMKNQRNRIKFYLGDIYWYWLQNATKKNVSASFFAYVSDLGFASYDFANYSAGVLPIILLK